MKRSYRFLIPLIFITVESMAFTYMCTLPAGAQRSDSQDRARAEEASCIATLRTINVSQATYQGGDETKGFARTLKKLGPAGGGYIDAVTATGKKDGYRFRLTPVSEAANSPVTHYTVTAMPIRRLVRDQRSFYNDETNVIRFTTKNRAATAADPPINSASTK